MTTIATRSFRIFGPNAGKSGELGGHYFHEGILALKESAEVLGHVTRKLSRYSAYPSGSEAYDAALLQEELEKEAEADGIHDASDPVEGGGKTEEVPGPDGSGEQGAAETPAVNVPTSDNAEAGGEGIVSEGDGPKDTELPGDQPVVQKASEVIEAAAAEGPAPVKDDVPMSLEVQTEEGTKTLTRTDHTSDEAAAVKDETPSAAVDEKMKKVVLSLDPDVDEHWTEEGQPAMAAIEEAYGADFAREDVHNAVPEWDREKARELKDLS